MIKLSESSKTAATIAAANGFENISLGSPLALALIAAYDAGTAVTDINKDSPPDTIKSVIETALGPLLTIELRGDRGMNMLVEAFVAGNEAAPKKAPVVAEDDTDGDTSPEMDEAAAAANQPPTTDVVPEPFEPPPAAVVVTPVAVEPAPQAAQPDFVAPPELEHQDDEPVRIVPAVEVKPVVVAPIEPPAVPGPQDTVPAGDVAAPAPLGPPPRIQLRPWPSPDFAESPGNAPVRQGPPAAAPAPATPAHEPVKVMAVPTPRRQAPPQPEPVQEAVRPMPPLRVADSGAWRFPMLTAGLLLLVLIGLGTAAGILLPGEKDWTGEIADANAKAQTAQNQADAAKAEADAAEAKLKELTRGTTPAPTGSWLTAPKPYTPTTRQ